MAQIPWAAHRILLDSFADQPETYVWYVHKAGEQRWSVRQLKAQINFTDVLEPDDADAALHATKDPYVFDFLELTEDVRERELEQALMAGIQRFLIELGAGFAFYGRQKPIVDGGDEFFVDLRFYHHTLRRFVVIELKIGRFRPEHVAKMNFYLNAVDEQLRLGDDRESVGVILCTDRNETVAKLALHRVYAPIAVSTWRADRPARDLPPVEITEHVPADLGELAALDAVRTRLIDRIGRHGAELHDRDHRLPTERR